MHLILDTLVGGILWLWPVDNRSVSLAVVPALYDHWIMSVVFHWSFLIEITITILATGLWLHDAGARSRVATGDGSR